MEEIDKIAPSNNDDKRLQTFDGITIYPYDQFWWLYNHTNENKKET